MGCTSQDNGAPHPHRFSQSVGLLHGGRARHREEQSERSSRPAEPLYLVQPESPHWRPRDKAIEKFNRKIERFVKPLISGRDITGDLHVPVDVPPLPRNFAALRSYEVDGAKVGMAVLSTVTSLTTMQFPLTLEEFGPVLLPAWRSAHRSLAVGQAVRGLGYDQIVTFNGRHCYSRPFCDVLQETTEVIRYEQASAGDKYIAVAGSVQEPATLARLIEAHQFNAAAGEAFFHERMNRETSSEVGFTRPRSRPVSCRKA